MASEALKHVAKLQELTTKTFVRQRHGLYNIQAQTLL